MCRMFWKYRYAFIFASLLHSKLISWHLVTHKVRRQGISSHDLDLIETKHSRSITTIDERGFTNFNIMSIIYQYPTCTINLTQNTKTQSNGHLVFEGTGGQATSTGFCHRKGPHGHRKTGVSNDRYGEYIEWVCLQFALNAWAHARFWMLVVVFAPKVLEKKLFR